MPRSQKIYYLLIGFFAFAAFGAGYGLPDIKSTSAQASGCALDAADDWCSKWSIAKWVTPVFYAGNSPDWVDGSIGPSDWQVSGATRINDTVVDYSEEWRLTTLLFTYKANVGKDSQLQFLAYRDGGDNFKPAQGNNSWATADSTFKKNGYEARSNGTWNALYYGQLKWGPNGEPGDSRINVIYPTEWQVKGRFAN